MKPEAVGSARQALAVLQGRAARQMPFQVILTDLHMPEIDGFGLVERIRTRAVNAQRVAVLMLTSGEPQGLWSHSREMGIAACLTKPVRRSELREALSLALAQNKFLVALGAPAEPVAAALPTAPSKVPGARPESGPPAQSIRVLLAEDDDVNVLVACGILEKAGYRVDVARNGHEVLPMLAAGSFDVVLMDIQMPGMDGFEATAAIREKEKHTGGRIPIIAMTAHAVSGYRERCLAAGMDDYVSKPIRFNLLLQALNQLQLTKRVAEEPPAASIDLEVKSGVG